jgi:Zn-dependent protease with chaperone function
MEHKRSFPEISPSAWEHPADRAALAAFASLPLAGDLLRRAIGSTTERSLRLGFLANAARATDSQFAPLRATLAQVAERLDLKPLPELFVRLDPAPDVRTLGVESPFIVVTSGALGLWDEEELAAILAHEVGHVLSGHAVYKTLLALILRASSMVASVLPLGGAALAAASAALREWDRKSELSADRAALVATQDPPILLHALMKSAAGPNLALMDINEFFRQARDYEVGEGGLDSLFKLLDIMGESHPFPVVRMVAIQEWERVGEYREILAGNYPRRGQGEERDPQKDFERARASYEREFAESQDPLSQAAGKMFDAIGQMLGRAGQGAGKPDRQDGEREGGGRAPNIEDAIDEIFGKRR